MTVWNLYSNQAVNVWHNPSRTFVGESHFDTKTVQKVVEETNLYKSLAVVAFSTCISLEVV